MQIETAKAMGSEDFEPIQQLVSLGQDVLYLGRERKIISEPNPEDTDRSDPFNIGLGRGYERTVEPRSGKNNFAGFALVER